MCRKQFTLSKELEHNLKTTVTKCLSSFTALAEADVHISMYPRRETGALVWILTQA